LCQPECTFYSILILYFTHNGMSSNKFLLAYLIRQEKLLMWVKCYILHYIILFYVIH